MIRKFLRRWSRKLHRFLGLVLGIPFALICISGALLAFEPQLLRLVHPEHYRVDVAVRHERLPVDEVYARVSSQLPDTVQLGTLRIGQPDETWQIEIASLRYAELFVNPYTGKLTGMQDHDRVFFMRYVGFTAGSSILTTARAMPCVGENWQSALFRCYPCLCSFSGFICGFHPYGVRGNCAYIFAFVMDCVGRSMTCMSQADFIQCFCYWCWL